MNRMILAISLLALAACSESQIATASPTTWHVDYAAGSDSAAGTSPATAWKHAPGDPNATATPASTRLQPGDTLLLRGGVPYRGAITLSSSGSAAAPITISGAGFGAGMGIIDGSEPVLQAAACKSAEDCGGAPDWKLLHRIRFAPPATQRLVLFGKSGPYWASQTPTPVDPFLNEATSDYAVTTLAMLPDLKSGLLRSPELAREAKTGGALELAFWVRPNFVRRVPVLAVEGDTLRFNPEGILFYEDRDGRVALNGSFAGLAPAGTFVSLKPGLIIAHLRPEDTQASLGIGSGRFAIEINGQSNIVVKGIHFRNLSGSAGVQGEGRAISSTQPRASNIEIKGNLMGPAFLEESNSGLVRVVHGRNFRIIANRIENIALGTALSIGGHDVGDLIIEGNVLRRIGRSGIYILSVDGAIIRGNIVAEIRGIHGNAITAYLANRDILIEGNFVVSSDRPVTFHGNKEPDVENRITIRNNIFVASPGGQAAINSWGRGTNTVSITGNVVAGARQGMLLNGADRNMVIENNDGGPIVINGTAHESWRMSGNRETLTLAQAVQGQFSEDACKVPASRLKLSVERAPR